MKNIALIFAGGTGTRMHSNSIPKQFLLVYNKPIIIYTIEKFELSDNIDFIVVVCLKECIKELYKLLDIYKINKVKEIVEGGSSGQESIYKGLESISNICTEKNNIVLIHDGVRPFLNDILINKNISTCKKYGNCITIAPLTETICIMNNKNISSILNREVCFCAKAPQTFFVKDIYAAHKQAILENYKAIDSAQLMDHYGYKLHTTECDSSNIKITTQQDFYYMRALLDMNEFKQLKLM